MENSTASGVGGAHVPRTELDDRLRRLRRQLDAGDPEWGCAIVMGKVNLYYLTGTMPNGVLIIPRAEEATLWVRRSYERAKSESAFPRIEPMRSFRELVGRWSPTGPLAHIEKEVVTVAHLERFNKHLGFAKFAPLDHSLAVVRAVKSEWELAIMRRSGELHRQMLEVRIPRMLREGMSEADFGAEVFHALLDGGYHGVARVGMFDTELFAGNFCFGESAVHPNPFDGPGGLRGLCPAVPLFASRERKLKRGDLVFVDVGCGVEGYHSDKTMVYAFGFAPGAEIRHAHELCLDVQKRASEWLRPGVAASAVFEKATAGLPADFLEGFMGLGDQQVKFLGHGVGLLIDEWPVVAPGFDQPLAANMTVAIEPKKGIPEVGMVGIENTFLTTADGGVSLTGNHPGLLEVS